MRHKIIDNHIFWFGQGIRLALFCDLHYLCRNRGPNSTEVIKSILHVTLEDRLKSLSLTSWRRDVTNEIDQFPDTDDLTSKEQRVALIRLKLSRYERLEAISLLELRLWKRKNDECKAAQTDILGRYTRKKAKIDESTSVDVVFDSWLASISGHSHLYYYDWPFGFKNFKKSYNGLILFRHRAHPCMFFSIQDHSFTCTQCKIFYS